MKLQRLAFSAIFWAATCVASNAATYTFTRAEGFPFLEGWFVASDQDLDGRIDGSEVTAYRASYGIFGGTRTPSGVSVDSAAPGPGSTFFDVDFNYLTNTVSSLSFGFSRQFDCQSFPDGAVIKNGRTVATSFSVFGTSGTFRDLGRYTGFNAPEYCDAYDIFTGFTFFDELVVSIRSDGGPAVVPLPAGLALSVSGLWLMAVLALRKGRLQRQPTRVAAA